MNHKIVPGDLIESSHFLIMGRNGLRECRLHIQVRFGGSRKPTQTVQVSRLLSGWHYAICGTLNLLEPA